MRIAARFEAASRSNGIAALISCSLRRDLTQGRRGGPWTHRAGDSPAILFLSLFFRSRENPACSRTRLERSRASTGWLGRPTGLSRGANLLSMNDVGPESLTTPAVEGRSLALPYRSVPGWGLLAEDGCGQPSTSGRAWLSAGGRGCWWVVGERASGCGRRVSEGKVISL